MTMTKVPVCCPSCRAQFLVAGSLLGKRARCKLCLTHFVLARAVDEPTVTSSPWRWVSRMAGGRAAAPGGAAGAWQPGDVILDLYEVREVFTSGGMGLVYRVRHRGWDLDLAVKCPRPEFFRHEQDKENFEREAETWVKLGLHPHTVTCYYVRRLDGIPHVFAEYVSGGSLAEWVRTRRLYAGGPDEALRRVLDVAVQFAWGLQHAHEQGLVHRDVKPGNVLLTAAGVAKVTDFGMARARGGGGEVGAGDAGQSVLVTAGGLTPAYCSPEQVRGDLVSRKTDVWSWGVSVLEMFTGAATWSGGYLAPAALDAFLSSAGDPDLPRLPPALADLLRRCFRQDPDERPRDMLEVVAALEEIYREATGSRYGREAPLPALALADSLNNRAVSLLDLKKEAEAERLWEDALAADPLHPECTYNLGLGRWRGGRLDGDALVQQLCEVCASRPRQWLPRYLLAQVHLEQGDWHAAREALEGITGAAAGLEVVRAALAAARAWSGAPRSRVRCCEGHGDWVSSVFLSADGRLALSGSADRTLRLWDTTTGQCLRTFTGHTEWVTSAALSSDGRLALSGSADRTLRLWDVAAGECLRTLEGHDKWVLGAALSPDGSRALSGGGDGLVKVWDVATGAEVRRLMGHQAAVAAVGFGCGGRLAVSGGADHTLRLWDLATGECLHVLTGHADRVLSVCLSADGLRALSGGSDRTVRLWEAATGECLRSWAGHEAAVHAVSLSGDGRLAVSAGADRVVRLWRPTGDRCLAALAGHAGVVNSVCLDATGRSLVSGSADRTLALWDLPADRPASYLVSRVLPSEAALAAWADYEQALARAAAALAAGDAVAAARRVRRARAEPGYGRRPEAMAAWGGLYVRLPRKGFGAGWEGATLEGHLDAVTCLCVSRDGRHAVSGSADRGLRRWEVSTGQCLRTLEGHRGAVTSVCCGRDGGLVLSGDTEGTVRLWEAPTGRCLRTFEGHDDMVTAVALGPDERLALSGGVDGTLRLWDAANGRCLYVVTAHPDPVHAVALSPDGRHALSGSAQFLVRHDSERLFTTGELKLWEVASGHCLHAFGGHGEAVTAVGFAADGCRAVSGGGQSVFEPRSGRCSQSGQVHLWEVATGRRLVTCEGHAGAVTSVCLSGDGRHVVSGSTDRTLRLWEADGACLRTFSGHAGEVTAVALTPDGRWALSGGADGLVKVWVLDWELADAAPADWDDGARPYLEAFLDRHTPYAVPPPEPRGAVRGLLNRPLGELFRAPPAGEVLRRGLTRRGRPVWSEEDFEELLHALGCAGYGWLRPAGIRRQLARLARARPASP
jgi:WD40 repeat protein